MELVILIGLQAAGKSTFARQRFAATHEYVSKDLLANNRRPDRRQAELVTAALGAGRSVVVDNTNPTIASRAALIALGNAFGARVTGYYFPAPASEVLARNRARTGTARVPDVAIYATRKQLVPPSAAEGFAALYAVRIGAGGGFDVYRWQEAEHGKQRG
ncbi:MAG TPA: AAA family ATPase [Chloroflexota bacterium]|jgi:predicted kinase|nr:AAA family ATPase [Chloroflexota bacterium]